jgi:hypothetical protein
MRCMRLPQLWLRNFRLKMGAFYHRQIGELLIDHSPNLGFLEEPENILHQRLLRRLEEYTEQIRANREKAIGLIVEMLRYQDWPVPSKASNPR